MIPETINHEEFMFAPWTVWLNDCFEIPWWKPETSVLTSKVQTVLICFCHHNTQKHVTINRARKCTRLGNLRSASYGNTQIWLHTDKAEAHDTTRWRRGCDQGLCLQTMPVLRRRLSVLAWSLVPPRTVFGLFLCLLKNQKQGGLLAFKETNQNTQDVQMNAI